MSTLPELLTIDAIADLYKVSRCHARDVIVKAPDFPPPAPGSGIRKPRWLASDVRAYLRRRPHAARTAALTA